MTAFALPVGTPDGLPTGPYDERHQAGSVMDGQHVHHLLGRLGPAQFTAVAQVVEVLAAVPEPLSALLDRVPEEGDDVTSETSAALDRARASLQRGEGVAHDEILREFGLIR
jgi:hypothetical protein